MKLSHFKNKFIILRYNFYYLKIALNCIGIKDNRLCGIKLGMKIASIVKLKVIYKISNKIKTILLRYKG